MTQPDCPSRRRVVGRAAAAAGLAGLAGLASPAVVAAHQLTGRFVSPIPLGAYLVGAVVAVAASFAIVLGRPGAPVRPYPDPTPSRVVRVPRPVATSLGAIGLLGWVWIVMQAVLLGGHSEGDAASLFLWVYGWVGLALACAFVGPAWEYLDPFGSLHRLLAAGLRTAGLTGGAPAPYPARLGRWPAALGFAVFVWLELAVPATRGGQALGLVLVGYTVLTLIGMAQFGREGWRRNGEVFSVWFGLVGRLAPLALPGDPPSERPDRVEVRRSASGLLEAERDGASLALVSFAVAGILYDGLSQTQAFFDTFGAPGVGGQTVLLVAWLALVGLAAFAVGRLVGVPALVAGLIPIAVGYLLAHYLTYLLFDGQRIVYAISDPAGLGWNLLGLAGFEPSTGWLPGSVAWAAALVAVVGGHVLGAWAGHSVALRDAARGRGPMGSLDERSLRARQVPLAAIMLGLTVLTLWSLGQAIVVAPAEPAAAAPAAVRAGVEWPPGALGTHSASERTSASRSRTAGSSASAAATAVSIAVRQRIPSAVAARRISAASRTAPDWGVGVFTTRRTSPEAMRSRIGGGGAGSSGSASAPYFATSRASWPSPARARAVPSVAANR